MKLGLLIRLLICLFGLSLCLYSYVDKNNALTQYRLKAPARLKELKLVQEENKRLRYELERFHDPANLLKLAKRPEFAYLKQPSADDVLILEAPSS